VVRSRDLSCIRNSDKSSRPPPRSCSTSRSVEPCRGRRAGTFPNPPQAPATATRRISQRGESVDSANIGTGSPATWIPRFWLGLEARPELSQDKPANRLRQSDDSYAPRNQRAFPASAATRPVPPEAVGPICFRLDVAKAAQHLRPVLAQLIDLTLKIGNFIFWVIKIERHPQLPYEQSL